MESRAPVLPALNPGPADSLEPFWTVLAGALFALTGVVAVFIALTGLAVLDPIRISGFAPAAVLLAAAMTITPERGRTSPLGAAAGACGVVVWLFVLLDSPPTDLGLTVPILLFAGGSALAARVLEGGTGAYAPDAAVGVSSAAAPAGGEGWIEEE